MMRRPVTVQSVNDTNEGTDNGAMLCSISVFRTFPMQGDLNGLWLVGAESWVIFHSYRVGKDRPVRTSNVNVML